MFGLRVLRPRLGAKRVSAFFFLLLAVKADFFNCEQCICALVTDPQISLFINFFIKNRSHDIIHTFKNYFATVFFSFQLYPNRPIVKHAKHIHASNNNILINGKRKEKKNILHECALLMKEYFRN